MAKTRKRKDHAKRTAVRKLELQHARHRQMKEYTQQLEAMKSARLNELLGSGLDNMNLESQLSELGNMEGINITEVDSSEALSELEMLQVLDTVDPETVKPIDAIDVTVDEKGV
jgi:hypothetical protein